MSFMTAGAESKKSICKSCRISEKHYRSKKFLLKYLIERSIKDHEFKGLCKNRNNSKIILSDKVYVYKLGKKMFKDKNDRTVYVIGSENKFIEGQLENCKDID